MTNQEKEKYSTFPCTGKLSMVWQWETLRATLDGSENLSLLPGIQPTSLCHPACNLCTVLCTVDLCCVYSYQIWEVHLRAM